jgi:hypothetical protein
MSTALCVAALGQLYARTRTRLRVGGERRRAPAATDALTGARLATSPSPSAREHEMAVAPMYTPASFSLVKPLLAFLLPVSPLASYASLLRAMLQVSLSTSVNVCALSLASSRPRSHFEGYRQIRPSPLVSVSVVAMCPMQCVECNASNPIRPIIGHDPDHH